MLASTCLYSLYAWLTYVATTRFLAPIWRSSSHWHVCKVSQSVLSCFRKIYILFCAFHCHCTVLNFIEKLREDSSDSRCKRAYEKRTWGIIRVSAESVYNLSKARRRWSSDDSITIFCSSLFRQWLIARQRLTAARDNESHFRRRALKRRRESRHARAITSVC